MRKWQFDKRTMKVLRIATISVFALWILLFVVPVFLLRIPSIQREVGAIATRKLTHLLATPVSVGSVGLAQGNVLSINQVLIQDSTGRRILSVDKLLGTFSWLDLLLEEEVRISSTRLFGLSMELYQDPNTGRLNIQHIIEHLANQDSDSTSSPLVLNTILIRDASFSWLRGSDSLLIVDNISTKVNRLRIAQERVSGVLEHLSAEMRQGPRLERLSAQVDLQQERLKVSNLQAHLPNSHIHIPQAVLHTTGAGLQLLEELEISRCDVATEDLASLSPQLNILGKQLSAKVKLVREGDKLALSDLDLSVDTQAYCTIASGDITLDRNGAYAGTDIPSISWGASAKWGQQLLDELAPELKPWSHRLTTLGKIRGESSLYHPMGNSAQIQTNLRTDKGQLRNKATLTLEEGALVALDTSLDANEWQLKELLKGIIPLQHLSLQASLKAYTTPKDGWQVEYLRAEIPTALWAGNKIAETSLLLKQNKPLVPHYDFSIKSAAPIALGELSGSFDWLSHEPRNIILKSDIRSIDLSRLGLSTDSLPSVYSLVGSIALDRLSLDTQQADITLEQLSAWSESDTLLLSDIQARLTQESDQIRRLKLESPWLEAEVYGHYQLSSLPQSLSQAILERVPHLSNLITPDHLEPSATDVEVNATIKHIPTALAKIIELPLSLSKPLTLSGRYRGDEHILDLDARGNELSYGGYTLEDWSLSVHRDSLLLSSNLVLPKGDIRYEDTQLRLSREEDKLHLYVNLGHTSTGVQNGQLNLSALLRRGIGGSTKSLGAELTLSPSKLRIHNQLWSFSPAHISIDEDSLSVQNLRIETHERSLHIAGGLGKKSQDKLHIDLNHINLGYILSAAGVDFDMIDMDLTGHIQAELEGKKIRASADLHSDSLLLNQYRIGALQTKLNWDSEDMNIYLDGIIKQGQNNQALVSGYIRPANGSGIDLRFDANSLELGFTSVFLNSFADNVSGLGQGSIRLFGQFIEGVTIAGEVDVRQGNIGIKALGTQYSFENKIRFTPTEMIFEDIELHDAGRGRARLDGNIRHRYFGNMRFDLNISEAQRIQVLNTSQRSGIPVYGLAYGSGNAKLHGTLDRLALEVDLKSDMGTDVTLDFLSTRAERDERLVAFKPLRPEAIDTLARQTEPSALTSPAGAIDMRLNIEVTPVAKQTLRMGEGVGNDLKGRTEGRLQINIPYVGVPTVFGGLNVVEGNYVFRLEQLAHKRFTLREGSRLDFRGDPMKASINLQASYALTANIADLDEDLAAEARRTNIPVHCLLKLSGELAKPDIRFGIELPGAEAELERRVRSLLHTDDAINRQMLYLIALGKFSPREDRVNKGQDNTTSSLAAVASSAISEQLSYLLGGLSSNINIGTSIKTRNAAFEDTDIELLFSGSWFNNRLLVNGNLGYHDNPFLQNTYIGEFDIEYKLNRTGSLRLKAYNHYNNMYQYLRQSMTTQGFGILWRQRFDTLSELFSYPTRQTNQRTSIAPLDSLLLDASKGRD